ncbi:A1pp-domain-containing protein [Meredithblackwellia eburnea MCA 4105]
MTVPKYPLSSYKHLIDLSPPSSIPPASVSSPDVKALLYLYREYHEAKDPEAEIPDEHELSHVPYSQRAQLIRSLLTLRSPELPLPPPTVMEAIDAHIESVSASNPDPLVPVESLSAVPKSLFPSVDSASIPRFLDRITFFRGDMTRLSSPTLAIVNAANRQMLGCFQPAHLCVDNVIHAASGPRLRNDCNTIMATGDWQDAEVGEALVTRAWSLPSGYVIHTAGPQLSRGSQPTEEQKDQLAASYRNSLDVAKALGTIDTVAFPCISTGIFAFPGDQAAVIAIETTQLWMEANPDSQLKVIFTLFSPKDAADYLAGVTSLHPSLPPPLPLPRHFQVPDRVKDWFRDSDSVIIHAGAGLSADAVNLKLGLPLDYNSKELFRTLYPALLESTEMRTLYHSIGYQFPDPLIQWAFILAHGTTVLNWGSTPIYQTLLAFAESKSQYTVMTSNADQLFYQNTFDPERIFTPQGTYSNFQCLKPCTRTSFFSALPWFEKAKAVFDGSVMRLPEDQPELIPKCEKCGGPVFLNVRGGNWFLETPQMGQRERYEKQVREMVEAAEAKGKTVLLLELGAGFNTPSVIRYPSEHLVRRYKGTVKLVRINLSHPEVPGNLKEDAAGLKIGAVDFFDSVK